MSVRDGETYVHGQDKATVGALLAAADRLGISQRVVRTVDGGLIVPTAVHEEAFPPPKATRKAATNHEETQ